MRLQYRRATINYGFAVQHPGTSDEGNANFGAPLFASSRREGPRCADVKQYFMNADSIKLMPKTLDIFAGFDPRGCGGLI